MKNNQITISPNGVKKIVEDLETFGQGRPLCIAFISLEESLNPNIPLSLASYLNDKEKKTAIFDATRKNIIIDALSRKGAFESFTKEEDKTLVPFIMSQSNGKQGLDVSSISNTFSGLPADIYTSGKFANALKEAKVSHHFVFLLLPSFINEKEIVLAASKCDGVVLFINKEQTEKKLVYELLRPLSLDNVTVISSLIMEKKSNNPLAWFSNHF